MTTFQSRQVLAIRLCWLIVWVSAVALNVSAYGQDKQVQELHILGGLLQADHDKKHTFALQADYQETIGEGPFGFGITYFNEGHIQDHHRDGMAAQLWLRTEVAQWLKLEGGIGPYQYFDTAAARSGLGYTDVHGLGLLASGALVFPVPNCPGAGIEIRINRSITRSNFDATSILAGLRFDLPGRDNSSGESHSNWHTHLNEVAVSGGVSIVNSFSSESSRAFQIQYRRRMEDSPIEFTLGYLNEGHNPHILARYGLVAQLWLVRRFSEDRWELGIGYGPYFAIDSSQATASSNQYQARVSGRLSIGVGRRFSDHLVARLFLNRITTDYSRDTDVAMLGLGYEF